MEHIKHCKNCATAIPRKCLFSILIFNHAFFIGNKKNMGCCEITILSKRYLLSKAKYKYVVFSVKTWSEHKIKTNKEQV